MPPVKELMDERVILLVEDDPDDEFLFVESFSDLHSAAHVTACRSPYQLTNFLRGVAARAEIRPSIIFLDSVVPPNTAAELSGEIRQVLGEVPIVLLTGMDSDLARNAAKDVGAIAVLPKPIDAQKLESILQEVCPTVLE